MSKESTRRRILDAVVALHREVGPAATTISAIAERAGVQRLTVYRHFPDERALLQGCSAHWTQGHPPPDPSAWAAIEDPRARLRSALESLYGYFDGGQAMLTRIFQDEDKMPALQEVVAPFRGFMTEVAGGLSAGWGVDGPTQRLVRVTVGHAMRFETWSSLSQEGLSNEEAAGLMAELVTGVAEGRIAHLSD